MEFALILFPFLILVAGVIQFGLAISFWQDQQRLATQAARIAITNCQTAPSWCSPSLEANAATQPLAGGNRPTVDVCFTSKSGGAEPNRFAVTGDGVRVRVEGQFALVPILRLVPLTLSAKTTMQMEQTAQHPGIVDEPLC